MKTALVFICLLVIGALICVFTYQTPSTTEITVFRDVTDKYLSRPEATEILSLYNFSSEYKWNGGIFRYSTLSDISYNSISEITINAENKWLSNEPERDKEIKKFMEKISDITSQEDSIGKMHSSVYLPLARELKRLSKSDSERRIVIIYSDLMENDPDVSLYEKKEFELLTSNPGSLVKLFKSKEPLPSLSGIEIYIVYRPSDVAKDAEFRVVSEFYRKMLERNGARVNISANLAN
ncbi:MAG TPA: hypothetical protein VJY62_22020 [Bacteroidia bacterium]|nr:hypothetical protein [Bacteroidia bacterium]